MKILNVSIFPAKNQIHEGSSGVSWYTKNLVSNIPYSKEDQIYVVCNKVNNVYETYKEEGVYVIRCFNKDYRFIFQILKEVNKIKPDVIHIQQELALYGNIITSYLLQWLLFSLRMYKTVITLHGIVSLKSIDRDFIRGNNSNLPVFLVKSAFLIVYIPLCLLSKKVIVHEYIFKQILVNEYFINPKKIEVVPIGIEDLKCKDTVEARVYLNLPLNKKIVLFMGYLTGYKGLDLLIEGFSEFIKSDPESVLILGAGIHPKLKDDENYQKEYLRLKNKAEKLLGSNHIWVGFINEEDIVYYYSAADVSVYPYTSHISSSGPMSIAIGYEKPFISSNVFNNFIEYKKALFERNPASLSSALKYFYSHKSESVGFVLKLKGERAFSRVGFQTYSVYSNTNL